MTSHGTRAGPAHQAARGANAIVALREQIKRAMRRRAGRFRTALLVFVLLLPLLLASVLGDG